MLKLEKTLRHEFVFSPDCMFWTCYCYQDLSWCQRKQEGSGTICTVVDDDVLIAELVNERTEKNTGILCLLWRHPWGQVASLRQKAASPDSSVMGSILLLGIALTLRGNWIPSKTCLKADAVCDMCPRHIPSNKWCLSDDSKHQSVLPEQSRKIYLA